MIEVEHLSKVYGSITAIEDVSFKVEKGEILGLLGPNGAGKTTTMRILSGYLPATKGQAWIAGKEVHEHPMAVRKCIGYLPEVPPLYREMTVEDFLKFVTQIKGVAAGERDRCINAALLQCGLEDRRRDLIRKLSKGYRQRVGIAQAIVHEPLAIILDEPSVGLDPRQIIEVRNLIKSLAGDRTIILSSHILSEVRMICDRVAIIHQGRVVAIDSVRDLVNPNRANPWYEIEIAGKQSQAQALLLSLDQVDSVQPILLDSLPEGHYRFKVKALAQEDRLQDERLQDERSEQEVQEGQTQEDKIQKHDLAPLMASCVIHAGMELYEIKKVQTTLEEIFLRVTMEESISSDDQEISQNLEAEADAPSSSSTLDEQVEDKQAEDKQAKDEQPDGQFDGQGEEPEIGEDPEIIESEAKEWG